MDALTNSRFDSNQRNLYQILHNTFITTVDIEQKYIKKYAGPVSSEIAFDYEHLFRIKKLFEMLFHTGRWSDFLSGSRFYLHWKLNPVFHFALDSLALTQELV